MPEFYPAIEQQISELEIKHSRFITLVTHTKTINQSDELLQQVRALHKKANHHCWARICGPRSERLAWGSSDDGEPKGTAGRPMLNVLEHSELCEVTVVVTRYFGGIKLGTGGLVRAYSQAVQEALTQLPILEYVTHYPFKLNVPHPQVGDIEQLLAKLQINVQQRLWTDELLIDGIGSAEQLTTLKQALIPWQHQVTLSSSSNIL